MADMNSFPQSLVQIHYHNRPGGVWQVMEQYSACFRSVAGEGAANVSLCAMEYGTQSSTAVCCDVPEARYHMFFSDDVFKRTTDALIKTLMQFLTEKKFRFPVAVIGHNLCLGKNYALSAAFTHCAELLGNQPEMYRFFSVLHDFAPDGRPPIRLPAPASALETSAGEKYLYAGGAPVHFITPGHIAATITGLSKRELTVVPNPLAGGRAPGACRCGSQADGRTLKNALALHAEKSGSFFDPLLPLYCYPSRMIHRKNLYEALLVTGFLLGGSLVTGAAGTRSSDKKRIGTVSELSAKYRISFAADAGYCIRQLWGGASDGTDPFPDIIGASDACITTSRAEGFGYSLFTPWLYKKNIVGRMPAGTSLLGGMHIPSLYTRLPIPATWVSVRNLYLHFKKAYQSVFQKEYWSLQQFVAGVIIKETIDFALLTDKQQISVLIHLARNGAAHSALVHQLEGPQCGWPGLAALTTETFGVVEENAAVAESWRDRRFTNAFIACLKRIPCKPSKELWYTGIVHYFSDPARFRPFF